MEELNNKPTVKKDSHKKGVIYDVIRKAKEQLYQNSFHESQFIYFASEGTVNKIKESLGIK